MARRDTGATTHMRAYRSDYQRIVARWREMQQELPSATIPDVIRAALDAAGLPAEPTPQKRRRPA